MNEEKEHIRNEWDAYGYCVLTSRLEWLRRTEGDSPEIPSLEDRIDQLAADLAARKSLSGKLVVVQ